MPKLSIVITTKNRKKDLLECVKSICASTYENFELIIVDDASTDGTEKLKKTDISFQCAKRENLEDQHIKIFHQKKSLMMVKARNFGAKKAQGRYILFIDDDNIIDTRMIEYLVLAADKYLDYGILGPSMYYFESREKYMDYQKFNFYTGRTKGLIDNSKREIVDTDGIPNVFLIKKEVFKEFGFFDEKLIQTFTEPDFAFNVRKKYKCGIVKRAVTYHKIPPGKTSRSMGAVFKQKAYCLMRNRSILISRYGNLIQKFVYMSLFSWIWPFVYSILMIKARHFYLVKLYFYGFKDGMVYFFRKKFINSLPKLL
jgi:hypothetical protein